MDSYIIALKDIDKTFLPLVGPKAANLGELSKIDGIKVPAGFCISSEAFKRIVDEAAIRELISELTFVDIEDGNKIRQLSAEIRQLIEGMAIPANIHHEILHQLSQFGKTNAYAIRSSATVEDMPMASAAGQQDSYLNIIGEEEILKHISKCWASLFTERAVMYRIQNNIDHRQVYLSVIVQQMVFPQVSGVLFTADPLSSNRKVVSIDASFGLGEALVSGLVNADNYKVRDGKIIDKTITAKKILITGLKFGGTKQEEIELEMQNKEALPDEKILQIESVGRKIEKHFGSPQDIEWCLKDDAFYIVQSRPITTLYPIPNSRLHETGLQNRLYISVGHQQMMTDAMKPLGLSFFQLTAGRPMYEAGGRLFVDITKELSAPVARDMFINMLGKSDPLLKDAILTIMERGDFIESSQIDPGSDNKRQTSPTHNFQTQIAYDPAIVPALIKASEDSIKELRGEIQSKSGSSLFDFIMGDLQELKKSISDPRSFAVIMTAMNASTWINEKMNEWLGETNVADILSQSVPNNITSEMGLDLLNVADAIRPYPEVVEYLQNVQTNDFLDDVLSLDGGQQSASVISNYLDKYGMRCAGEIDITRPRWAESPLSLVPLILTNIKRFESGAAKLRFEKGWEEALNKEAELLHRLRQLDDGEAKVAETKRMIELLRNYAGYREYPKYAIVNRYFIYKQALLQEAGRLVEANLIRENEDVFYLSFEELQEVVRSQKLRYQVIIQRKEEFKLNERLRPPRVITSDGEIITGKYQRPDIPADAILGLVVSPGVVEGRARVILKLEDAEIDEGDILVTTFTDPSWTPLFVSLKGMVTEVGGMMTHGAVIAREYGLPAIVGVENATRLIRDGQMIRVNAIEGYIQFL